MTRKSSRREGDADARPGKPPRVGESGTADARVESRASSPVVVGIGASAGGLEALKEFFSHLPEDSRMAFVVVTHQHPGHPSFAADLLSQVAHLPVAVACEGDLVEPGHVYVAPPGGLLAIVGRTLHRMEAISEEASRLPIDFFLRSLAHDQQERAICIVLSGSGADGTQGLRTIKAEGGMAMVQDAASALYSGMPSSAASTGLADYVLPPADLARQLLEYARRPFISQDPQRSLLPEEPLQQVFFHLQSRTGHDFSGYKTSTIRRRIERRLSVHGMSSPAEYLRFLAENPHEIDILFKELLISVTGFFRDPEAFEWLGAEPLKQLLESRSEGQTLRVWVPGCATGEEAYSLTILLCEIRARLGSHCDIQVFGTDLDADSIKTARGGSYPEGIASDLSPERLERFFQREEGGGWRIRKEIRQRCIFAQHNLVRDAPFTKIDLLSCRNLLIYLDSALQKRLLPVLHFALKPGGLLFLGPSESIGNTDLFETVSPKWKLFRRREVAGGTPVVPDLPLSAPAQTRLPGEREAVPGPAPSPFTATIERLLLQWYCPASVVINARGDIIHIHGRTGAYLEPAAGQPRMNVLEMAREGLQTELNHALRQISREPKAVVRRQNLAVSPDGRTIQVSLSVRRIEEPEALRGLLVVTFQALPPQEKEGERRKRPNREPQQVEQLERELQLTKESLQSTIEQLETSNEDLKSTNEELQSTNEELQSTNEELETSKEEMQSLNEELTTVNTELQNKVEALAQANDDMQNLLNSTDIATVFLDNHLNIKRYTEQAKYLIKLIPSDVGRPIGDLVSNLDYDGLEDDCRRVFRNLNSREIEVRTKAGNWYLMRIMPYRTAENVIDGLVITFVDLSYVHRVAQQAQSYCDSVIRMVREPMVMLDTAHGVQCCNLAFAGLFGSTPEGTARQSFWELGGGVWDVPPLRRLADEKIREHGRFENCRIEVRFPAEDAVRAFLVNGQMVECVDRQASLLLAFTEVI